MDQSLWLVTLPVGTTPTRDQLCQRQLTESLIGVNDIVSWSLSPDQQWLAYVQLKGWRTESPADQGTARLLHLTTGETRLLFNALLPVNYVWTDEPWDLDRALFESRPLWSPDSQQLILVAAPTGQSTLYRYDLSTAKPAVLARSPQNIAWPQWSPDAKYLLYNKIDAFGTGAGPTGGALWVVRADGTKPAQRLSQTDEFAEFVTQWLDNTHVRTHKEQFARGSWDWSTVDVATGKRLPALVTDPTSPPCWIYSPARNELTVKLQPQAAESLACNTTLGPTGRYAAVTLDSTTQHSGQLLLLDLATGTVTQLATAPFPNLAAFDVSWSPGGDLLLWTAPTAASIAQHDESGPIYALWAADVVQKQAFVITDAVNSGPAQWVWLAASPHVE